MKKIIPLLLTLTALSGNLFLPLSASASTTIDEKEYWSIDELLAHEVIAEQEITEACGDDRTCANTFFFNQQSSRGGIWNAYREFKNSRFKITAVNPTEEYLRVIYRDENLSARFRLDEKWHEDLVELYIAWLEPDQPKWISARPVIINHRDYFWPAATLKRGETNPGLHAIFVGREEEKTPGWFTPNQEIEIPTKDLAENTSQEIYNASYIDFSGYNNVLNYSACVNSADYESGMECRLLFGEERDMIYAPFWPDEPTSGYPVVEEPGEKDEENVGDGLGGVTENEIPQNPQPDNNTKNTIVEVPKYIYVASSTEQGSEVPEESSPAEEVQVENLEEENKAPLSSQITTPALNLTTEQCSSTGFAWWWIVILFGIADGLIMWWFWPKHTKNPKK